MGTSTKRSAHIWVSLLSAPDTGCFCAHNTLRCWAKCWVTSKKSPSHVNELKTQSWSLQALINSVIGCHQSHQRASAFLRVWESERLNRAIKSDTVIRKCFLESRNYPLCWDCDWLFEASGAESHQQHRIELIRLPSRSINTDIRILLCLRSAPTPKKTRVIPLNKFILRPQDKRSRQRPGRSASCWSSDELPIAHSSHPAHGRRLFGRQISESFYKIRAASHLTGWIWKVIHSSSRLTRSQPSISPAFASQRPIFPSHRSITSDYTLGLQMEFYTHRHIYELQTTQGSRRNVTSHLRVWLVSTEERRKKQKKCWGVVSAGILMHDEWSVNIYFIPSKLSF